MTRRWPASRADTGRLTLVVLPALVVAACGGSSATAAQPSATRTIQANTTSAPTPTPTPASADATPTPLPFAPPLMPGPPPAVTPAIAWLRYDAQNKPQVWASIQAGPARQIGQIAGEDCDTVELGTPVVSPDALHIAVVGGAGCGDGQSHGPVFILTVATGQVARVPNADALTSERSVLWLGNNTVVWTNYGVLEYRLGAPSAMVVPNLGGAVDAVLRGTTLFALEQTMDQAPGGPIRATLHRYSMVSQHDMGPAFDLGSFGLPVGASPGDFHYEGWDVSPNGTGIVYQVTGSSPGQAGITTSHIYTASADGSGTPTEILRYLQTSSLVRLRLSPDGQRVAVTEAEPVPDVLSGCVSSPGDRGDPCFHAYTLPANLSSSGWPVWAADGGSFLAGTSGDGAGPGIYRFTLGATGGVMYRAGAACPWGVA